MYDVVYKNYVEKFDTLALALDHAKQLGVYVVIKGNGMEIVGIFGADSIQDGKCPDGVDYTWKKRRR
jgi:hypothetical protein